ncbi:MAG: YdcF family protein [Pleurocapsa sp. MO_192.B19]|nr:YdcF family protein [Pleurocapsa sp. MO_192.B19]
MKLVFTKRRFIIITIISILISIVSIIPIRIAIARYQAPTPQAILTLGGGHQREVFTAEFARSHPNMPIWVSSGSKEVRAREIFQSAGVDNRRIYLDRRATDTVTNFTTLVNDFKQQNIKHIYLITSDFHLPRAKAIAFVVLGSQGITYTPIALTTNKPPESQLKIVRDVGRSFLWVITKRTGSSLNPRKNSFK